MLNLPKWIREMFSKSFCPYCKEMLKKEGVYGIGCREERVKKKSKRTQLTFCYEYRCPSCKNRSVFTGFPTNWDEFLADMLEVAETSTPDQPEKPTEMPKAEADSPEPKKEEKKKKPKGISAGEIKDVMKMLEESQDLRDFFGKIGIVPEQEPPRDDKNK